MNFIKKYKSTFLIVLSCFLYFFFGYFLERSNFIALISSYSILFISFYFLLKWNKTNWKLLAGTAFLFRLIFLFTTPNLSQDFYRFIWDGRMLLEGLNPYLYLPDEIIQQPTFPITEAKTLHEGMGDLSAGHFTNYPPLNQLCFLIAALFASKSIFGSVIVLRVIIILADVGILYFGSKILSKLQLPKYRVFWYILNPFIIIEMTGNLHFESVMLFFLVWSFYVLFQNKWILSGILLTCSIAVKLIPLLFLPLFYQWFSKRKGNDNNEKEFSLKNLIAFYAIIFITIILVFLPFYSNTLIDNYWSSVGLWFKNFEFNASYYYVFRKVGFWISGYNQIAVIGKIIPVLTILFLTYITFFRKNKTPRQLITACLIGLSFYYFLTTTMHPWYVSTLLILAVFTKYRFAVVWSFTVMFSYSAYQSEIFKEQYWLIFLEYLIVYSFLIWELVNKRKQSISLT